jgi:alkylated DNA nucleotide flippase Atl1
MRKALVVGIDYYSSISRLTGCVNDARAVSGILERHSDGAVNFASPRLITSAGPNDLVKRAELKEAVRELFADDAEIALFYFAGHGHIDETGGFLCAADCETGDDGVSLNELLTIATQSTAKNKVIILDSCNSGIAGARPTSTHVAEICEGMTILTASTGMSAGAKLGHSAPRERGALAA